MQALAPQNLARLAIGVIPVLMAYAVFQGIRPRSGPYQPEFTALEAGVVLGTLVSVISYWWLLRCGTGDNKPVLKVMLYGTSLRLMALAGWWIVLWQRPPGPERYEGLVAYAGSVLIYFYYEIWQFAQSTKKNAQQN